MIPILYTADETQFRTNGLGRLSDCTRCIVTEERNGIYECEFDYPITGVHFEDIDFGRIVACTHDDRHDIQPFIIYSRTVPDLNGVVTFNAYHISYRLNKIAVMPFSASSVATALQGIAEYSVNANPFSFWTDKATTANFENAIPRMARAMLGGEENSILDVFGGGEYEFDRFEVKLYANRGVDSDVEIRYSKNLTDLNETRDFSGTYNAVVPFWTDSEGNVVVLPEKMLIYSGLTPQTAYLTDHNLIIIRTETNEPIEVSYTEINAVPLDMTEYFEEQPTVAQLRNAARTRFENSGAWLPSENLTVDFVQLWQTEEFKEYSALQRVRLCDTVSVYYPQAGVSQVKQKVVRVVYNVLLDRYDEIEIGSISTTLGQVIREDIMQNVPTTSMMDEAIKYATDMIRGGLGGYVVMTPGPNGYPQEILIMDTPDINTAVNVWRFNQGGLGHSSNGYDGPFTDIALTQDGKINASMITTGFLNANYIRAGTISDESGRNYWNLTDGEFVTRKGKIAEFDISSYYLSYYDSGRRKTMLGENNLTISTTAAYADGTFASNRVTISDGELQFGYSEKQELDPPTIGYINAGGDTARPGLWFMVRGSGSVAFFSADECLFFNKTIVQGEFVVRGTKSRLVETDNYSDRLLYCYETPTPLFGDIGEAMIDEDGFAFVEIDDIFSETVAERVEYQVFLQAEGEGTCYVAEKNPRYFLIKGTPNLKVAWELKAKQRDYEMTRLERSENGLEEYSTADTDDLANADAYIKEMEGLLYG